MEATPKDALSLRIKDSTATERLRRIISGSQSRQSPPLLGASHLQHGGIPRREPLCDSTTVVNRGFPRIKSTPVIQSDSAFLGAATSPPVDINGGFPSFRDNLNGACSPEVSCGYKPIFESLQIASDMREQVTVPRIIESHSTKTPLQHLQEARLASPPPVSTSSGVTSSVYRLSVLPTVSSSGGIDNALQPGCASLKGVPVTCIGFVNVDPKLLEGHRTVRISNEFGEKLRMICSSRPVTQARANLTQTAPIVAEKSERKKRSLETFFERLNDGRSPSSVVLASEPCKSNAVVSDEKAAHHNCNISNPFSRRNGLIEHIPSVTDREIKPPTFPGASTEPSSTSDVNESKSFCEPIETPTELPSNPPIYPNLDEVNVNNSDGFSSTKKSRKFKLSKSTFTPKATLKRLGIKRKASSTSPESHNKNRTTTTTAEDNIKETNVPLDEQLARKQAKLQALDSSEGLVHGDVAGCHVPRLGAGHWRKREGSKTKHRRRSWTETQLSNRCHEAAGSMDNGVRMSKPSKRYPSLPSTPSSDGLEASKHASASMSAKSYLLVPSYKGFKDFSPIVIGSRTRSRVTGDEKDKLVKHDFPILVVKKTGDEEKQTIVNQVQGHVTSSLPGAHASEVRGGEEAKPRDEERERRRISFNRTSGETILHKAARLGYAELAERQLRSNANVDARDNAGWTALHEACSRGQVDVARVLLHYGADVSVCSKSGIRPLHDAVDGGHVSVLRELMAFGADPLIATYTGVTALDFAKTDVIKALLKGHATDAFFRNIDDADEKTTNDDLWQFRGSSSVMDHDMDDAAEILCNAPQPQLGNGVEFLVASKPFPTFYHIPVFDNDVITGYSNYMLLSDALDRARMKREKFLFKYKSHVRDITLRDLKSFTASSFLPIPLPEGNDADSIELIHLGPYAMQSLFGWKFSRF